MNLVMIKRRDHPWVSDDAIASIKPQSIFNIII